MSGCRCSLDTVIVFRGVTDEWISSVFEDQSPCSWCKLVPTNKTMINEDK